MNRQEKILARAISEVRNILSSIVKPGFEDMISQDREDLEVRAPGTPDIRQPYGEVKKMIDHQPKSVVSGVDEDYKPMTYSEALEKAKGINKRFYYPSSPEFFSKNRKQASVKRTRTSEK